MSLQRFLVDNRLELIERTRALVARRQCPQPSEAEMEHGTPVFLSQLGTVLCEEEQGAQKAQSRDSANAHIMRSATLHGRNLRRCGFTIEQVVRGYGDVCQAVTELADGLGATLTTAEFHTLNWCLDNAIASAVTSWNDEQNKSVAEAEARHDLFRIELLNLVSTAAVSFDALPTGRLGSGGTTAGIFRYCLVEMRSLLDNQEWVADWR